MAKLTQCGHYITGSHGFVWLTVFVFGGVREWVCMCPRVTGHLSKYLSMKLVLVAYNVLLIVIWEAGSWLKAILMCQNCHSDVKLHYS